MAKKRKAAQAVSGLSAYPVKGDDREQRISLLIDTIRLLMSVAFESNSLGQATRRDAKLQYAFNKMLDLGSLTFMRSRESRRLRDLVQALKDSSCGGEGDTIKLGADGSPDILAIEGKFDTAELAKRLVW